MVLSSLTLRVGKALDFNSSRLTLIRVCSGVDLCSHLPDAVRNVEAGPFQWNQRTVERFCTVLFGEDSGSRWPLGHLHSGDIGVDANGARPVSTDPTAVQMATAAAHGEHRDCKQSVAKGTTGGPALTAGIPLRSTLNSCSQSWYDEPVTQAFAHPELACLAKPGDRGSVNQTALSKSSRIISGQIHLKRGRKCLSPESDEFGLLPDRPSRLLDHSSLSLQLILKWSRSCLYHAQIGGLSTASDRHHNRSVLKNHFCHNIHQHWHNPYQQHFRVAPLKRKQRVKHLKSESYENRPQPNECRIGSECVHAACDDVKDLSILLNVRSKPIKRPAPEVWTRWAKRIDQNCVRTHGQDLPAVWQWGSSDWSGGPSQMADDAFKVVV